jgi:hypothetical protein
MTRPETAERIMQTFEDRYESLYATLRPAMSASDTQRVLNSALRHVATNQLTRQDNTGMVEDHLIRTIQALIAVRIRRLQIAASDLKNQDSTPMNPGYSGDRT